MINIVCFKWGDKFSVDYYNKFYASLLRNTTVPIEFTCFTENPSGLTCPTKPFLKPLPYWWYIIGLFNPDHQFKGRVVYFDIDTVITDNIDHILCLDKPFITLRDYYRPNGLQTAYISFLPKIVWPIWDKLCKEFPKENYQKLLQYKGGTNRFLENSIGTAANIPRLQDLAPDQCHSYKVDIVPNNDQLLKKTKLVFYHGKPMPHERAHLPWMKQHWAE